MEETYQGGFPSPSRKDDGEQLRDFGKKPRGVKGETPCTPEGKQFLRCRRLGKTGVLAERKKRISKEEPSAENGCKIIEKTSEGGNPRPEAGKKSYGGGKTRRERR